MYKIIPATRRMDRKTGVEAINFGWDYRRETVDGYRTFQLPVLEAGQTIRPGGLWPLVEFRTIDRKTDHRHRVIRYYRIEVAPGTISCQEFFDQVASTQLWTPVKDPAHLYVFEPVVIDETAEPPVMEMIVHFTGIDTGSILFALRLLISRDMGEGWARVERTTAEELRARVEAQALQQRREMAQA